ncbi:PaaI family thioesterase [Aestuariimicrobium sp. T2.26MG-19.2B]|uniref:PaaI family thioesterase n=1 Tax=Aestuariimicrobium sp. T2.26MG-19.2B TaxID=3040679 RepID=UPI0024774B05|nr:hotdog fold thioesterase [Aestuariimicrobium sp. T2.26MG-19.2B]CAI9399373.1 Proofreading thioesterase EntH [Aestuariimicrobium sp. T2.26MG-19.2B]
MTPTLPEWADHYHSALDDRMGIELVELSAQRVVARYPVAGNTQPMGLWHGGASAVVVETLASLGAFAHAREQGKAAVGVDLSVTHHRPVRSGWVTGTALPLHVGRTTTSWEVVITDENHRRVATGRLTCQFVQMG